MLGLALALLTWAPTVPAQLPPLLEVSGQYLPPSEVPGTSGLRAQIATYDGSVNVPIPLGASTFLLPGISYHVEGVSYERAREGFAGPRVLHALDVSLLFTHALSQRWWLSLRGSSGLAGDFQAIDSGHLRLGGLAMATYAFGDHLVVGAGGLVTHAFGDLRPLPLVYLDWRPLPWWRIEANLPLFANLTLGMGSRFEVGVVADLNGNEYAIRDRRIQADPNCASGAGACMDHVAYAVVTAGPVARVRLFSTVWLSVTAGRTLWRRFELKDARNRVLPGGGEDLPAAVLLRAGLVWRVPGS